MKLFENDYEVNLSKKEASEIEVSDISKNCEIEISDQVLQDMHKRLQ